MNPIILLLGGYALYNILYTKNSIYGGNKLSYNYYVKPSNLDRNFQQVVKSIVDNNLFWKKKGFNLNYVLNKEDADFTIELRHRDKMPPYGNDQYDNGKKIYFSLTIDRKLILIDHINWQGVPESKLSVEEYKEYVILHEIGHAIGFDHIECSLKNNKCNVMYQMTRGPPKNYNKNQKYGVDYESNEKIPLL
jgi:hypothetical protein